MVEWGTHFAGPPYLIIKSRGEGGKSAAARDKRVKQQSLFFAICLRTNVTIFGLSYIRFLSGSVAEMMMLRVT